VVKTGPSLTNILQYPLRTHFICFSL